MDRSMLFLDIDGVLNTSGEYFNPDFNEESVARLKNICDTTGAGVVIISQWRLIPECMTYLRTKFASLGIDIMGVTPQIHLHGRAREIQDYIFYNYPTNGHSLAIVDDQPAYYAFKTNGVEPRADQAVFVNPKVGIDEAAENRLIKLLTPSL